MLLTKQNEKDNLKEMSKNLCTHGEFIPLTIKNGTLYFGTELKEYFHQ